MMNNLSRALFCALLISAGYSAQAQVKPISYLPNAHSHNDYTRNNPFVTAYGLGFGSIEADLFFKDGELYVAHEPQEIQADRTFSKLYLEPILEAYKQSKDGYLYPNQGQLQLLIDAKTAGDPILKKLTELLKPYRSLFDARNNPKAVKLVISGNRPQAKDFQHYDDIFFFDGNLTESYQPAELERIGMISAALTDFTPWNGLGRFTVADSTVIKNKVDSVHQIGKKIRFWGSPDTRTTWYEWQKFGIDFINTDKVFELADYLRKYPNTSYEAKNPHQVYQPQHQFAPGQKPKHVILLISDGAGLSQLWAAAMANRGLLNVMNMPYTGYLNTVSVDNYHTDSAAGGSALATGVKTRNRHIGVDAHGKPVKNLPDNLMELGMSSGIISNDELTGATPSAFYTHVPERDMEEQIAHDILNSKLNLLIGGQSPSFAKKDSALVKEFRKQKTDVLYDLNQIKSAKGAKVVVLIDDQVDHEWNKLDEHQSDIKTSFRMIEHAFQPAVSYLKAKAKSGKGFFLMVEGAKIDGGGHSNSMSFTVEEYLSFDRLVGQALQMADQDQETLVIVTSDHETGGLVLLDANKSTGHVLGNFATTDHTGIPVPIAAYGPGAEKFQGFLDNTDVAKKIYELLKK